MAAGNIERRQLALPSPAMVRIEKRAEGEPEKIVGYAAVFYNAADPGTEFVIPSSYYGFTERIMPGAFDRAIREDDVRALFNHDPSEILGRTKAGTLRLSVDAVGLRYEIDPPGTADAAKVLAAIQRGDITGSSFSFAVLEQVRRDVKDADGKETVIREIVAAELFDVGPVTFPAYTSSTTGVRSDSDHAEARAWFEQSQAERRAAAAAIAADLDIAESTARLAEISSI